MKKRGNGTNIFINWSVIPPLEQGRHILQALSFYIFLATVCYGLASLCFSDHRLRHSCAMKIIQGTRCICLTSSKCFNCQSIADALVLPAKASSSVRMSRKVACALAARISYPR